MFYGCGYYEVSFKPTTSEIGTLCIFCVAISDSVNGFLLGQEKGVRLLLMA